MRYLFLLFCSFSIFAQTKGVVIDTLGNPIPYVSIFVENENKTTTSEENGTFSIQVLAEAKLIFSALGYEKKTVLAKDAAKVVLKSVIFDLQDVVIKKANKPKTLEIGKVSNSILEAFDTGPKIDAKFFPFQKQYNKTKWIKKIMLFTDSPIEGASIKLHLYSVVKNGAPGDELLTKDLIVYLKKGIYRHQFDIYDMDIEMPENGIFVAFEKMRIENNRIEKNITDSQTGMVRTEISYAPKVLYHQVKRAFMYSFSGGSWHKRVNEEEVGQPFGIYEPTLTLLLSN